MNQQEACLQARHGEDVVFLGCRLSGELRGLMFEAQVEQGFRNPSKENIEVAYTFPLPWGAVLLGVEVLLGNKHLSGRVVEKAQAEARYEEALSEGDAAIMLGAMASVDPKDSTSAEREIPDYEAALTGDIRGKKIGHVGSTGRQCAAEFFHGALFQLSHAFLADP